MKEAKHHNYIAHNPARTIMFGFFFLIILGATLLNLPISSADGESIGFVDALFTATSAVCVTGLVVVNTMAHWSGFGKVIILCLIQVGGLGFMTFITLLLLVTKKKITLKERLLIKESYNQNSLQGMVRYVKSILIGTVAIEVIGAVILGIRFSLEFGFQKGLVNGIFHSVSAFCNAGFDILGDSSLMPYANDIVINVTIMFLIVIGGLGFMVWTDILRVVHLKRENRLTYRNEIRKLSLHSKTVFITTAILILSGAILFFLCEVKNPNTMGGKSLSEKILASFMQSVTVRTAGFNTIDQGDMTYASKFLTVILMFIGGSPGGTAGGIKTVTLSVLLIAVISVIKGSKETHVFERKIPFHILQKSLAVFFISLGAVVGITMILTFTEKGMPFEYEFMDLLFEVTSALGTVGVTTGITPNLSVAGRLIITFAMFMGRLGPISIVIALARKQSQNIEHVHFVEENVIVG